MIYYLSPFYLYMPLSTECGGMDGSFEFCACARYAASSLYKAVFPNGGFHCPLPYYTNMAVLKRVGGKHEMAVGHKFYGNVAKIWRYRDRDTKKGKKKPLKINKIE